MSVPHSPTEVPHSPTAPQSHALSARRLSALSTAGVNRDAHLVEDRSEVTGVHATDARLQQCQGEVQDDASSVTSASWLTPAATAAVGGAPPPLHTPTDALAPSHFGMTSDDNDEEDSGSIPMCLPSSNEQGVESVTPQDRSAIPLRTPCTSALSTSVCVPVAHGSEITATCVWWVDLAVGQVRLARKLRSLIGETTPVPLQVIQRPTPSNERLVPLTSLLAALHFGKKGAEAVAKKWHASVAQYTKDGHDNAWCFEMQHFKLPREAMHDTRSHQHIGLTNTGVTKCLNEDSVVSFLEEMQEWCQNEKRPILTALATNITNVRQAIFQNKLTYHTLAELLAARTSAATPRSCKNQRKPLPADAAVSTAAVAATTAAPTGASTIATVTTNVEPIAPSNPRRRSMRSAGVVADSSGSLDATFSGAQTPPSPAVQLSRPKRKARSSRANEPQAPLVTIGLVSEDEESVHSVPKRIRTAICPVEADRFRPPVMSPPIALLLSEFTEQKGQLDNADKGSSAGTLPVPAPPPAVAPPVGAFFSGGFFYAPSVSVGAPGHLPESFGSTPVAFAPPTGLLPFQPFPWFPLGSLDLPLHGASTEHDIRTYEIILHAGEQLLATRRAAFNALLERRRHN